MGSKPEKLTIKHIKKVMREFKCKAQQETSLVDATSQLPTTNTLPAAPLPPKGVKQKKSYLSPGKEQATSPGSTRSAESLGPLF
ncbi:hypothetical protein H4Q26_014120 [Puccinia striiformis f. sp. tritici PST-130]|nr:hypothetical protein H4Q26_014120 [Puccinia striiformis f. sp. tritici PST-130]